MEDERNTYREAVAAEVRAQMGRRRITQGQLAKALGMSQAAVSRRLTGELPFDLDDVLVMAQRFNVALSDLIPEPAEVLKEGRSTPGEQVAKQSWWKSPAIAQLDDRRSDPRPRQVQAA